MRTWLGANGGPLAVVILGLGIGGFTNRWAGIALIVVGGGWFMWAHVFHKSSEVPGPTVNLSFVEPRTDHQVPMIQRTYSGHPGDEAYFGGTAVSLATALTATGPAHPDQGRAYSTETRRASFAFARVVNSQCSPGVGVTAQDARCYITFFSRDNVWRVPEMKARWRDADSPLALSPFQLHTASEAIDIPADGEPRELDVAMKYPEDPYCYAYNNDNTSGHEWSRKPEHRIMELEFIAEVTVRGSNFLPLTRRFVVSHGGIGTVMAIRELES